MLHFYRRNWANLYVDLYKYSFSAMYAAINQISLDTTKFYLHLSLVLRDPQIIKSNKNCNVF